MLRERTPFDQISLHQRSSAIFLSIGNISTVS